MLLTFLTELFLLNVFGSGNENHVFEPLAREIDAILASSVYTVLPLPVTIKYLRCSFVYLYDRRYARSVLSISGTCFFKHEFLSYLGTCGY